jgi:hypothetical protein
MVISKDNWRPLPSFQVIARRPGSYSTRHGCTTTSRFSVIALSVMREPRWAQRNSGHLSDGICREAALILVKVVMPKFMFGIHTRDGRFIERVVDALNEPAARKLALEGFVDEEIRLCMVDTEPEGDPKKTEALVEALFELARRGTLP